MVATSMDSGAGSNLTNEMIRQENRYPSGQRRTRAQIRRENSKSSRERMPRGQGGAPARTPREGRYH
jgi:hypothetical protein